MGLEVKPVDGKKMRKQFIEIEFLMNREDPNWVPPLLADRRAAFDTQSNPIFEHTEVAFFLAYRDEKPVGRITAHLDRIHLERHKDETGFFGFFQCENRPETARALLDTAEAWLREKGLKASRGPMSFNTNEEFGCLIEGFDRPPMLLMPHNPSYYRDLIEGCGYAKCVDTYCWWYDNQKTLPPEVDKIIARTKRIPNLEIRQADVKHFEDEVRLIMKIWNSAWAANWGFVPLSEREIMKAAADLKMIVDPRLVFFIEVEGRPIAYAAAFPNINEAIRDLDGKLFPFGILKLLWRVKVKKPKTARVMMLGIEPEYRGMHLMGLSVLMYKELYDRSREAGYIGGELSWTLESNKAINKGIEFMGGERYRTMRVYEKKLG